MTTSIAALPRILDADGGRDVEIDRAGVERDQLRQQAENPLGVFSATDRDAIELALERDVGEATAAVVATQAEDTGIFGQIERAHRTSGSSRLGGGDAHAIAGVTTPRPGCKDSVQLRRIAPGPAAARS
jgi:hypothetical protein